MSDNYLEPSKKIRDARTVGDFISYLRETFPLDAPLVFSSTHDVYDGAVYVHWEIDTETEKEVPGSKVVIHVD